MAPKPKPWFRFYADAVHDRKLRRLRPEQRWLFVACLCAARTSPRPGWLLVGESPMGWGDLVDVANLPLRVVEKGADALHDAGLLGYDVDEHCWFVPNWGKRQFESDLSTPRANESRNKPDEDDATAIGPPSNDVATVMQRLLSDTESETETETEPNSSTNSVTTDPEPAVDDSIEAKVKYTFHRVTEAKMAGKQIMNRAEYRAKILVEQEALNGARLRKVIGTHPTAPPSVLAGWLLDEPNTLHEHRAESPPLSAVPDEAR